MNTQPTKFIIEIGEKSNSNCAYDMEAVKKQFTILGLEYIPITSTLSGPVQAGYIVTAYRYSQSSSACLEIAKAFDREHIYEVSPNGEVFVVSDKGEQHAGRWVPGFSEPPQGCVSADGVFYRIEASGDALLYT